MWYHVREWNEWYLDNVDITRTNLGLTKGLTFSLQCSPEFSVTRIFMYTLRFVARTSFYSVALVNT